MFSSIWWITLASLVVIVVWDLLARERSPLRSWLVVGIAFIVGMSIFGGFFLQSRKVDNGLRVVGYASKMFESDLVKWTLSVQQNTDVNGLQGAYGKLTKDVNDFRDILIERGLQDKDISIQPPSSNPTYNYGQITGYNVNQSLYILSGDIDKVEDLALDPQFFGERGLVMERSTLEYLYSKLPDLKQQLIGEATADAFARAREITGAAKSKVGKLRSARTGVFQITEPYSTEVSDYGYYNTNTRTKSISVTVTAEFEL
jgi:hypothetical protein